MDGADDVSMDGSGGLGGGEEETVVEFRAGLMRVVGAQLESDPRRGLVRLQRGADGLPRFQWLERMDGLAPLAPRPAPEIDFILFPGEATLSKIGAASARVFKLAFPGDAARTLYLWAQEPDAASDDATLAAFNAAANTALEEDEEEEEEEDDGDEYDGGGGGGAGITAAALAAALRAVGLPPPPPTTVPAAAPAAGAGTIDAGALAAALAGAGASGGSAPPPPRPAGPSLGAVLAPDALLPLVRAPGMLDALAPHLPEGHRTQEGLEAMVASAQFREQVDKFSHHLTSGALDLSHFGLTAAGFSVADFLEAVQAAVDKERREKGEGGEGGGGGGAS